MGATLYYRITPQLAQITAKAGDVFPIAFQVEAFTNASLVPETVSEGFRAYRATSLKWSPLRLSVELVSQPSKTSADKKAKKEKSHHYFIAEKVKNLLPPLPNLAGLDQESIDTYVPEGWDSYNNGVYKKSWKLAWQVPIDMLGPLERSANSYFMPYYVNFRAHAEVGKSHSVARSDIIMIEPARLTGVETIAALKSPDMASLASQFNPSEESDRPDRTEFLTIVFGWLDAKKPLAPDTMLSECLSSMYSFMACRQHRVFRLIYILKRYDMWLKWVRTHRTTAQFELHTLVNSDDHSRTQEEEEAIKALDKELFGLLMGHHGWLKKKRTHDLMSKWNAAVHQLARQHGFKKKMDQFPIPTFSKKNMRRFDGSKKTRVEVFASLFQSCHAAPFIPATSAADSQAGISSNTAAMAALAGVSSHNIGPTVLSPMGMDSSLGFGTGMGSTLTKRHLHRIHRENPRYQIAVALSAKLNQLSQEIVCARPDNSNLVHLFKREFVLMAFMYVWTAVFIVGILMVANMMFVPDWFFSQKNYLYYQGKVAYNLLD